MIFFYSSQFFPVFSWVRLDLNRFLFPKSSIKSIFRKCPFKSTHSVHCPGILDITLFHLCDTCYEHHLDNTLYCRLHVKCVKWTKSLANFTTICLFIEDLILSMITYPRKSWLGIAMRNIWCSSAINSVLIGFVCNWKHSKMLLNRIIVPCHY